MTNLDATGIITMITINYFRGKEHKQTNHTDFSS